MTEPTEAVMIRIPVELKRALTARAVENGRSVSMEARRILRRELAAHVAADAPEPTPVAE